MWLWLMLSRVLPVHVISNTIFMRYQPYLYMYRFLCICVCVYSLVYFLSVIDWKKGCPTPESRIVVEQEFGLPDPSNKQSNVQIALFFYTLQFPNDRIQYQLLQQYYTISTILITMTSGPHYFLYRVDTVIQCSVLYTTEALQT